MQVSVHKTGTLASTGKYVIRFKAIKPTEHVCFSEIISFLIYLTMRSIPQVTQRRLLRWLVNSALVRMWAWTNFMYYSRIFLEGMGETTKNSGYSVSVPLFELGT
jgi:hypothetical protein